MTPSPVDRDPPDPPMEGLDPLWSSPDELKRFVDGLGGRYALEYEAGSGGMAVVFRAFDLKHQRPVALKVMRTALGEAGLARFRREIALAAHLQHPHILPVFDSGESAGRLWYTMPYVEGETLGSRLRRDRRLAIPDAMRVLRQVAGALAHAHAHGIVHRDLKPDNIFLSGDHAIISDFGVAKAIAVASLGGPTPGTHAGDGTEVGVSVGTPAYMAPEQAVADPAIDHRADLYALGVVAYELLAGARPFMGGSPHALAAAHLTQTPAPLSNHRPEAPDGLVRLIARLLAKRADDRPGSATEVLTALDALTTSAPAGFRLHAGRSIAAALLIAILGIAILAFRGWRRPQPPAEKPNVQVAVFEDLTRDTALSLLGNGAARWMEQALSKTDLVMVILGTGGDSTVIDGTPAGPAGASDIDLTVGGSFGLSNNILTVTFWVTDTARQMLPWGSGSFTVPRATPQNDVLDTLAQRVLAAFHARYAPWMDQWAMGEAPKSTAALIAFADGLDRVSRGDAQGGLHSWAKAAALDSTYMQPRLHAAAVLGGLLPAVADTILDGVERRREALSDGDRAWLAFDRASLTGSADDAFEAAGSLVAEEPGAQLPYFFLAGTAVRAYRPQAALKVATRVNYRSGRFRLAWAGTIYFLTMTEAYHQLGQYRDELREARIADSLHPGNREVLAMQIRALVALDSVAATEPLLAQLAVTRGRPGGLSLPEVLIRLAGEFQGHGHTEIAHDFLEQALVQQRDLPSTGAAADTAHYDLARTHYLLGHYAEAERLFKALVRTSPTDPSYHAFLGAIADRRGRHADAERTAALLDTMRVPFDHGATAYALAQLEAQRRDTTAALAALQRSLTLGMPVFGMSIHQDLMLAPLWNDSRFKALLAPR